MDGRRWKRLGRLEVEEVALHVGALKLAGMAGMKILGEGAHVIQICPDSLGFIFALAQLSLDNIIERCQHHKGIHPSLVNEFVWKHSEILPLCQ